MTAENDESAAGDGPESRTQNQGSQPQKKPQQRRRRPILRLHFPGRGNGGRVQEEGDPPTGDGSEKS